MKIKRKSFSNLSAELLHWRNFDNYTTFFFLLPDRVILHCMHLHPLHCKHMPLSKAPLADVVELMGKEI